MGRRSAIAEATGLTRAQVDTRCAPSGGHAPDVHPNCFILWNKARLQRKRERHLATAVGLAKEVGCNKATIARWKQIGAPLHDINALRLWIGSKYVPSLKSETGHIIRSSCSWRKVTDSAEQIVTMYNAGAGLGIKRIARAIGAAPSMVRTFLIRAGIYKRGRPGGGWNKGQTHQKKTLPVWQLEQIKRKKNRNRRANAATLPLFALKQRAIDRVAEMKRYRNDPQFRMKHTLRKRINKFVKGENKAATTEELLGCSYGHFITHIEAQFSRGMSWKNHGVSSENWHIDHIVPCAAFDLSIPEQQKVCFHFTNLRPMWAKENIRKGAWHNGILHRASVYTQSIGSSNA